MEKVIFSITKITDDGVANVESHIECEDDAKALAAGLASFLYRQQGLMSEIISINALREAKPEIFNRHEVRLDNLPWENILNE